MDAPVTHTYMHTHTEPFLAPLLTAASTEGPGPSCWPLAMMPAWGQAAPRQHHPYPTAASGSTGGCITEPDDVQSPAWVLAAHPPSALLPGHPHSISWPPVMEGKGVPASPAPALPVSAGTGPALALVCGWVCSPMSVARRSCR